MVLLLLVLARLRRFLLRTKAEVRDAAAMPCLAVRGIPMAQPRAGLPIVWPSIDGYDQLGVNTSAPLGVGEAGPQAYEAARINNGVPANGTELTAATIPAEAGQWLIDASVDFTKG